MAEGAPSELKQYVSITPRTSLHLNKSARLVKIVILELWTRPWRPRIPLRPTAGVGGAPQAPSALPGEGMWGWRWGWFLPEEMSSQLAGSLSPPLTPPGNWGPLPTPALARRLALHRHVLLESDGEAVGGNVGDDYIPKEGLESAQRLVGLVLGLGGGFLRRSRH